METVEKQSIPARRRPRFLLLAYACSPYRGSEAGVGWNRALQAGRYADTWVICEGRDCRAEIERYLNENGPVPGVSFVFVSLSELQARLVPVRVLEYLMYYLWHCRALTVARRLHTEHNFDLAHQVNMCGYREPGFLWKLGIPFVWGPVGGTQNFPYRFLRTAGLRGAIGELARNVVNSIQLKTNRRVRRAARAASAILAANSTIQRDISKACHAPAERMLETGVNGVARHGKLRHDDRSGKCLQILWSGIVEPRKALPILIEALARMPEGASWQLRVVGDGPMVNSCRRLAEKRGISDRIAWLGWISRDKAIAQCNWADIFAFTSLRDTSGNVVLEALAHGVPVICFDHQGVADIVTKECGIKIPVRNPTHAVTEWSRALAALHDDAERLAHLSAGAIRRAADYLWHRSGEEMADVYRRVLAAANSNTALQERVEAPTSTARYEREVLA